MKRCPQCEFIYEDEQTRCDMDGLSLVFDQPTTSLTPTKPAPRAKRNNSRRSLLSAFGVVFGVLVFAIGFASLERAVTVSSEPVSQPQASVNQPAPQEELASPPAKAAVKPVGEDPTVTAVSKTAKATHSATRERSGDLTSNPAADPMQRNSLGTKAVILGSVPPQNRVDPSRKQPEMIRSTTPPPPAKKDSKVVSIVKKTGRLLKKPFRL